MLVTPHRPWARPPRVSASRVLRPVGSLSYRARPVRGSASEPPRPREGPPKAWRTHPGGSASWVYPPFGERAHAKAVTESSRPINVPALPAAREAAFRLIPCRAVGKF